MNKYTRKSPQSKTLLKKHRLEHLDAVSTAGKNRLRAIIEHVENKQISSSAEYVSIGCITKKGVETGNQLSKTSMCRDNLMINPEGKAIPCATCKTAACVPCSSAKSMKAISKYAPSIALLHNKKKETVYGLIQISNQDEVKLEELLGFFKTPQLQIDYFINLYKNQVVDFLALSKQKPELKVSYSLYLAKILNKAKEGLSLEYNLLPQNELFNSSIVSELELISSEVNKEAKEYLNVLLHYFKLIKLNSKPLKFLNDLCGAYDNRIWSFIIKHFKELVGLTIEEGEVLDKEDIKNLTFYSLLELEDLMELEITNFIKGEYSLSLLLSNTEFISKLKIIHNDIYNYNNQGKGVKVVLEATKPFYMVTLTRPVVHATKLEAQLNTFIKNFNAIREMAFKNGLQGFNGLKKIEVIFKPIKFKQLEEKINSFNPQDLPRLLNSYKTFLKKQITDIDRLLVCSACNINNPTTLQVATRTNLLNNLRALNNPDLKLERKIKTFSKLLAKKYKICIRCYKRNYKLLANIKKSRAAYISQKRYGASILEQKTLVKKGKLDLKELKSMEGESKLRHKKKKAGILPPEVDLFDIYGDCSTSKISRYRELSIGLHTYHLHLHVLIQGSDNALWMIEKWLELNPEASPKSQDKRLFSGNLNEVVKSMDYVTKSYVMLNRDMRKSHFYNSALSYVMEVMRYRKILSPFGALKGLKHPRIVLDEQKSEQESKISSIRKELIDVFINAGFLNVKKVPKEEVDKLSLLIEQYPDLDLEDIEWNQMFTKKQIENLSLSNKIFSFNREKSDFIYSPKSQKQDSLSFVTNPDGSFQRPVLDKRGKRVKTKEGEWLMEEVVFSKELAILKKKEEKPYFSNFSFAEKKMLMLYSSNSATKVEYFEKIEKELSKYNNPELNLLWGIRAELSKYFYSDLKIWELYKPQFSKNYKIQKQVEGRLYTNIANAINIIYYSFKLNRYSKKELIKIIYENKYLAKVVENKKGEEVNSITSNLISIFNGEGSSNKKTSL